MNLKLSVVNYQLSIILLLFFTMPLKAQVTIGAQKAPHSYSVLELASAKGGLRLPMLNTSDRDALNLTSDSTEANGLFIYNTDIKCVEFWSDGSWIALCNNTSLKLSKITGNNGVAKGTTGLIYSVAPVSGVTTYTWTVPTAAGWSITAGQGTYSITVTAGSADGPAGTISVTASNGTCSGTSTLAVSVGCPVKTVDGNWLTFMCYNLGAAESVKSLSPTEQAAYTAPLDEYGYCYQWGRKTDGHQARYGQSYPSNNTNEESGVVSNPNLDDNGQVVSTFTAAYGKFIKNNSDITYYDWRSPQDSTLWYNNGKTANDPCPQGWRVPTTIEMRSIMNGNTTAIFSIPATGYTGTSDNTWVWNDAVGTTRGWLITPSGSTTPTLFLPAAGYRYYNSSALNGMNSLGYYWSSSANDTNADYMYFTGTSVGPANYANRAYGASIRCVVDQ